MLKFRTLFRIEYMQPITCDKPSFYIFLDIDGVLLDRPNDLFEAPPPGAIEYAKKHVAYLEKKPNHFSNNYCSLIAAHHISPKALSNLDALIQKIEMVALPKI